MNFVYLCFLYIEASSSIPVNHRGEGKLLNIFYVSNSVLLSNVHIARKKPIKYHISLIMEGRQYEKWCIGVLLSAQIYSYN